MGEQPKPQPKCPECEVVGKDHVKIQTVDRGGLYEVAFCDTCGHVYGVFQAPALADAAQATRTMRLR